MFIFNFVCMEKRRVKHINCPNCNYLFKDINNFCPNCGQENHTHKLPVKHFIIEAVEGYFHFDTKIVNTLRDLVNPGEITRNYNAGKRVRYVSPIRFYILVSFVLFLILSFQNPDKEENSGVSKSSTEINFTVDQIDNVTNQNDLRKLTQLKELDNNTIDSYLDSVGIRSNWYNKAFIHNYIKVKTGHITSAELRYKIRKSFSTIMFLLMPIFAFYLLLFHYRLKLYYSEHLVFSVHMHTMAFILIIIWLLCKSFISNTWLFLIFIPAILIYQIWATKVVYQQRLWVVLVKLSMLNLIYIATLAIFFVITIVLSLL
jgi:hypothetical protein